MVPEHPRLLQLLERMRKWVVPNVVQQRRERDDGAVDRFDALQMAALAQNRERALCQVVDAHRMIEPRVRSTGIDQVGEPELTDVAQTLKGRRIDDATGDG